jgi:cystathionine beta-lyase/cystathionine gamma-synthase
MNARTFPSLSRRTLAASALGAGEPTTRALTPPIHVATTYVRDEDSNYSTGFVYGRSDNISEGRNSPCPDDLLRLSAGLEDPDDLYRDLQALSMITLSEGS